MEPDHSDAFFARLTALAELFDAQFSPAKSQLYFDALADLPFPVVVGALNAAARTCRFMPRPAELRALAVGDDETAAEIAWMALRKAMGQVGGHSSLVVADAALGEAIVAVFGSWIEACQADLSPEMQASKRKEFGRVYRVLRDRHPSGPRYLPGGHELHNGQRADWERFTPVALLDDGGIRRLGAEEAAQLRSAAGVDRPALRSVRELAAAIDLPRAGETA